MRARLLILLIITMPLFASKNSNFFASLFTEPFERVYFIMKDGTLFTHTDCYENIIYMRIGELEKALSTSEKFYKIKDIAIVIHNHRMDRYFTPKDINQYGALKGYGFNGLFMIYCHMTDKTYCLEDKKKGSNMKSRRRKKKGAPC